MNPTVAIDPGTFESQCVTWDGERVIDSRFVPNDQLLAELPVIVIRKRVCIEGIASYGMAVGAEVFTTCRWIGRFEQVCADHSSPAEIVLRRDVKLHLCGTVKAKDANIRQAIIDRFGGNLTAIGNKARPGPLYGVKAHAWAALALAITFRETRAAA